MIRILLNCGFLFTLIFLIVLFLTKDLFAQDIKSKVQNKILNNYYTEQEINCITEAVYFEARSESLNGHKAVMEVIINRSDNKKAYPNGFCNVIKQKYQFSYRLKEFKIQDKVLFNKIKDEVKLHLFNIKILKFNYLRVIDPCSDHFDGIKSKASWIKQMTNPQPIGNHIFYCKYNY